MRLTAWSGEGIQAAGHPTISFRPPPPLETYGRLPHSWQQMAVSRDQRGGTSEQFKQCAYLQESQDALAKPELLLKKSVCTYLHLTFWLKGRNIWKILLQVHHQNFARLAGRTSGTLCSLVSCLQVQCTHQNHFSRPETAFTCFSALILLNHDK
jgi:hypothetical protein